MASSLRPNDVEPTFAQDPISGVWTADLDDATLKVWVECVRRTDRRFDNRVASTVDVNADA